ncbi:unnamed protein product [Closterium sp. NIES-54]
MASLRVLTFDHEGPPIQFDTWLDDLQLYLLSDSRDSVSLFDHTYGASPALSPHLTVRLAYKSLLALYDAIVARYSSPATAALGPLLLPYLFPELSAFATMEDLVSHLRTSDARYRAALLAEFLDRNPPPMYMTLYFVVTRLPDSLRAVRDHFLALDLTALTIDLLEQHFIAAETRVFPLPPCPPSYASTAPTDVLGAEDVGAASACGKHQSSKGKGGKSGGDGSGGGGGGSSGGGSSGGGGGSGGGGDGGGRGGGGGSGASRSGGGRARATQRGGSRGGQRQQQQRRSKTPSPQQLREWLSQRGASGGSGSCPYVIRTGDRAGQTCGKPHTQHCCFSRLNDAWRAEFGDEAERPRWTELLRFGVAILDLDHDAILGAMYELSVSAEGDCYLCVPPDPGIEAAALGASESALPGTAPAEALQTFTLDSGASRCFFRDSTTLTPLSAPVPVRLADPSGGPVLACSSIVLLCPALPSGSLSGLHLPSFSTNLVSTAALQDAMVTTTTPGGQRVSICAFRLLLRKRFREDLPVLRQHSDRGGEFSSNLLRDFCRGEGILHSFTLPASLQQNGIAERRIGLVMEVARTSMIHAAAPHFLWPFAVRYAAHQLNLWPRVSLPETLPTLRWMGEVGVASVFRVSGSCAFVHDTSADKLSARAIPCGVTFDESVPFYRLFPYRSAPPPPPPLFLAPGPPPVDPLPPQGPAPSGVSQVDPLPETVPVEVAVGSGGARGAASRGAEPGGAESKGVGSRGAKPGGAEPGGAEPAGVEPGGAEPEGVEPRGAESEGAESGGAEPRVTASSGAAGARDFAARVTGAGGVGATRFGGAGVTAGAGGTGGAATAGPRGARTRGTGAAGTGSVGGVGAGGVGAGDPAEPGSAGAGGIGAGGAGAGGAGAGDPGAVGAGAGGTGAGGAGAGGAGAGGAVSGGIGAGSTVRPLPYFGPLVQQVLGIPSSAGLTPPLLCPPPDQSQLPLQPASPLPAPSPYTEHTGGLTERREPESRLTLPVHAVRTGRRVPCPRPPLVPGTHGMALRHSSVPLRVPLQPPSESSLPAVPDPESDLACAASPTVSRLLATVVTDPSFESTAASALVAELVDLAAACCLD